LTELPVVWRPRRTRIIAYTMAVVIMMVVAGLAVVMPPSWSVPDRVGFALFGVLVCFLLHLVGRPQAIADENGLTVVNSLRTHRYEWAEVLRVNYTEGSPWPVIDLSDGSSVGVMGIQGTERARSARALAELRVLLRERGEATER
jgi:hypothetical protein